jgi:hypothetical protein
MVHYGLRDVRKRHRHEDTKGTKASLRVEESSCSSCREPAFHDADACLQRAACPDQRDAHGRLA